MRTNVPESKSGTIKGKLLDDRNQWNSIWDATGIWVEPTILRRAARHPTSVHYGEPRLLRVTLNSAEETESSPVKISLYTRLGTFSEVYTSSAGLNAWHDMKSRSKRKKL